MDDHLDILNFTETFLAFEKENGVFSIKLKDNCFWDYIRYTVFNSAVYSSYNYSDARHTSFKDYVLEVHKDVFHWLKGQRFTKNKYDIVVFKTGTDRMVDNAMVNIYTSFIVERLFTKHKILVIDPEPPNSASSMAYACDVLNARLCRVMDKFKSRLVSYDRSEKQMLDDLSAKFSLKCNHNVSVYNITKDIYSFHLQNYKRYFALLKKIQPKLILYADNSSLKSVIQAAHDLNIPAVDLQHSLISRLNILYNYPDGIDRRTIAPTISDYILTIGEYWNSEYRIPVKRISVGSPFFDVLKKSALEKKYREENSKNIIMISMVFSKEFMIRVAMQLSDLLPDYTIYYKLRPDDYKNWRDRYPAEFAGRRNIRIIDNDEISLYEYFTMCRFQIGINSTALYEGMGFGLTTFILKTGWYQEMQNLVDKGYAYLVSSANEIAAVILGEKERAQIAGVDALFKKDGLENMEAVLTRLMQRESV